MEPGSRCESGLPGGSRTTTGQPPKSVVLPFSVVRGARRYTSTRRRPAPALPRLTTWTPSRRTCRPSPPTATSRSRRSAAPALRSRHRCGSPATATELVVVTVDDTGKTKRLAHTSRVELRPCDIRGAVEPGAPVTEGSARVVRQPAEVAAVKAAIRRKYLLARLGDLVTGVTSRVRRGKPRAGIRITLA